MGNIMSKKNSRKTNFIIGDHVVDYKTTASANFENRFSQSKVPDQVKRSGSHISIGQDKISYQTTYENINSQPRTLSKTGPSVSLRDVSKTQFKLGNDVTDFTSNTKATIGSTFDR